MKVAIYSRKSKFVEGSESIENQIQICREYIDKHFNNAEIFVYEDEGFSGGNTNRPQFKKLLKDAKNNMFNVLICYRLDRISRNIADFSNIINLLQDHDIDFVSIREQFDTSTPMGRAMMYIASVFAQLERETIAERVRDNMLELAKSGRWLGGQTPYGYNSKGSKDNIKLVKNKCELSIVNNLFNKYIELGSLTRLQTWTIKQGIRTRKKGIFDNSSLRNILENPVYIIADEFFFNYATNNKMTICNNVNDFKTNKINGLMVFNRTNQRNKKIVKRELSEWIVAIGEHEGIISSELWFNAQELLKENAIKTPRTGTSKIALLSTLLRCKDCGSTFRVSAKYSNGELTHHYYKCRTKEKSRGLLCNIKNINGYKADEMVINYMKTFDIDEYIAQIEYDAHKDELDTNTTVDRLLSIEAEIKKHKDDIDKLTEKLIETKNSTASKYIVSKIEKIDLEIKELEKHLTDLKSQQNESNLRKINYKILREEMEYVKNNIDKLSHEEQKRLLKRSIDVIYWDGNDLEIKRKR